MARFRLALLLCPALLACIAADPRPSLRSRRIDQRQQHVASAVQPSRGVLSADEIESIIALQKEFHEKKDPRAWNSYQLKYKSDTETLEEVTNRHFAFLSLDELFPITIATSSSSSSSSSQIDTVRQSFSDIFDSDSGFRSDLRGAMREDFSMDTREVTDYRSSAAPTASLMGCWMDRANSFCHLTNHFKRYNMSNIDGPSFIKTITSLCYGLPEGAPCKGEVFGSFIDIVGVANKRVSHSWHQDSGRDQCTVMVGFPKSNGYCGPGVFSHVVALTHRLPRHDEECPRLLADLLPPRICTASDAAVAASGEGVHTGSSDGGQLGEEHIIRPFYSKYKEVLVYNDRDVFHSAPDMQFRESLWRFM